MVLVRAGTTVGPPGAPAKSPSLFAEGGGCVCLSWVVPPLLEFIFNLGLDAECYFDQERW